nr:unnamed protein product [Callosobruchus chinensis]
MGVGTAIPKLVVLSKSKPVAVHSLPMGVPIGCIYTLHMVYLNTAQKYASFTKAQRYGNILQAYFQQHRVSNTQVIFSTFPGPEIPQKNIHKFGSLVKAWNEEQEKIERAEDEEQTQSFAST